jgi:hypothetical protein
MPNTVHFSKFCNLTKPITKLKYFKKQRSISKWHGSNNKSIEDKKRTFGNNRIEK